MSIKPAINALLRDQLGQTSRRGSGLNTDTSFLCRCCGQQQKPRQCPAYSQACARCHKRNHFAKMCKTNLASAAPRKNTAKSRQRHSKRPYAVEEADQQTKSDQESHSSNESYTLGMYPLRIDGIEKPTVWLSTVETKGGNITLN